MPRSYREEWVVKFVYRVALVASSCALVASFIVHVRSALGLGLYHWVLPFGFIIGLFCPICWLGDHIVNVGVKLWRKMPLQSIEDGSNVSSTPSGIAGRTTKAEQSSLMQCAHAATSLTRSPPTDIQIG